MKIKYLISIIFLIIQSDFSAQNNKINFDHISIESGLSQGTINTIYQDSKGFMWFGTEEGLNRYDGYEMKVFKNVPGDSNSLSANYVWAITEDSIGNLWFGIDGGGLNRYDPKTNTFKTYFYDENDSGSISGNSIQRLLVDNDNNLWVGTWGGGLNKYIPGEDKFVRFQLPISDSTNVFNNYIFSICEDSSGNIWIGTDGAGLYKLNKSGKVIKHFLVNDKNKYSISSDIISFLFTDHLGNVWGGTYGSGINKLDPQNGVFYNHKNSDSIFDDLKEKFILSITEDSQNIIWIGTLANGVFIYDQTNSSSLHLVNDPFDSKSLNTNNIRSIFSDASNNIWVGTMVEGLNKTDRNPQMFYQIEKDPNNKSSLSNNFVFSVLADNQNNLWVGTYGGGLNKMDLSNGRFEFFTAGNNRTFLPSNNVRSLLQDHKGRIWVGTYFGGLARLNEQQNSFTIYQKGSSKNELRSNMIRVLFEDNDKNLWVGTNGGGLSLYNANKDNFANYYQDPNNPDGISHNGVLSICEDDEKNIWIGTYTGGLNKFDRSKNKFTHFKNSHEVTTSISSDFVTELYFSKNGDLWIGTWGGGLNKFNKEKKTFSRFNEANGFASGVICGIKEDDEGILWISTTKGITKFNPSNNSVKNYNFKDGLQRGEFNPGASYKSADGTLYFGGTNGVNYFHPADIYESSFQPEVVITSFKVFNSEKQLNKNVTFTDRTELSYDENNFSFEFAALDFTNPSRNKYKYKLVGLDKDWIESGTRKFANYTHLDPGDYTFIVRGTNHSGIYSNKSAQINLIISPPFWGEWWFRILFTFLVVLTALYFYRRRISYLVKEKKAQEVFSKRLINSQESERERIASELHDSFGQNLLIMKNRALLGLKSDQNEDIKQQLKEISDSASSAIEEVRNISYNLHPYQLKRLGLSKAIRSIINNVEGVYNIKFNFESDNIDNLFEKDAEINIFRIVQECINNIVKHSAAGEANIKINRINENITIIVNDNGKGFNHQHNETNKKGGFGIQNMDRRIKLLKGKFSISSELNKGTKLKIEIPIDQNERSN